MCPYWLTDGKELCIKECEMSECPQKDEAVRGTTARNRFLLPVATRLEVNLPKQQTGTNFTKLISVCKILRQKNSATLCSSV